MALLPALWGVGEEEPKGERTPARVRRVFERLTWVVTLSSAGSSCSRATVWWQLMVGGGMDTDIVEVGELVRSLAGVIIDGRDAGASARASGVIIARTLRGMCSTEK